MNLCRSIPIVLCPDINFRSIINDTYRSQLCLLHPPHLIAIAAIYLTFILHPPARPENSSSSDHGDNDDSRQTRQTRRSSRNHTGAAASPKKPQDPITFLADLNVSLPLVASIAQEIISLYTLWDQYKEDISPDASKLARELTNSPLPTGSSPTKRSMSRSESQNQIFSQSQSGGATPGTDSTPRGTADEISETLPSVPDGNGGYITPAFLSTVLQRMREARVQDLAPLPTPTRLTAMGVFVGRSMAVNKRLERTQAAG